MNDDRLNTLINKYVTSQKMSTSELEELISLLLSSYKILKAENKQLKMAFFMNTSGDLEKEADMLVTERFKND